MRGGRGRAKSAAQYEYVSSPSAFKNKIHPLPAQKSMQNARKRGIVSQTGNNSTYPPPIREPVQKMQGFPKNKNLKF